jgi:hypothetical protein
MKHILQWKKGTERLCKASVNGISGEYFGITLLIYDDVTNSCETKESRIFEPAY